MEKRSCEALVYGGRNGERWHVELQTPHRRRYSFLWLSITVALNATDIIWERGEEHGPIFNASGPNSLNRWPKILNPNT